MTARYREGLPLYWRNMIRMARERRGWSQRELAAEAATSQMRISEIERGACDPLTSTTRRIFEVLGMTLEPMPEEEADENPSL